MKKILLIEDNNDIRENTLEILQLANYLVVPAENGEVGIELALKENPDLILCDITMPKLSGYDVLDVLTKTQLSNVPFIFLSAKAEESEIRKALDSGADAYLTKPFDDLDLLDVVENQLTDTHLEC